MPWLPDFTNAVELARLQTRAAGQADPVAQYVAALNSGDTHALEAVWPAEGGRLREEDLLDGATAPGLRDHGQEHARPSLLHLDGRVEGVERARPQLLLPNSQRLAPSA